MTEVKAKLNHFRVSPRKVRLVADLVKGLPVDAAIRQLAFSNKRSGAALLKLLKSAVSNAKNNLHLSSENLYIKEFRVDEGPVFKRYMPRARGRATAIRKKTSHISLILDEMKIKEKVKEKNKAKTNPKTGVKIKTKSKRKKT
jgi:large subunit ribosomal protein L22